MKSNLVCSILTVLLLLASFEVFGDRVFFGQSSGKDIGAGNAEVYVYDTMNEDSPFGFHPAGPPFDEAKNIGIQWTRDGSAPYLFWSLVDPDKTGNPAQFQWRGTVLGPEGQPVYFDYDSILLAREAGLHILHNIDVQPEPSEGTHRQFGSWLPVNEVAYRNFVKEAVKRYSFIRYWQVGNEPNIELTRHPTDFADLQRITFEAIKEADPEAHVLLAGLAGNMGTTDMNDTYYESVLPSLNGKYMDVFDIHFYGDAKGGTLISDPQRRMLGYQDFGAVYTYFRDLLDRNGFSQVPIWVTEMGTFSGTVRARSLILAQTEAEQASDLLKRWVYPLSLGVQKVFWAFGFVEGFGAWNDDFFDHTGLIYGGQDGVHSLGERKLGYYTLKLMTEKLEGSDWTSIQTIQESDGVYVYKFLKNGSPIWVAWNDNAVSEQITILDIASKQVEITGAVPRYKSGKDVTDYDTAFETETKTVSNDTIEITLKDKPVLVEEKSSGVADLNKDGVVNMIDVSMVARAFGSKLGDPNWNAVADIDRNGIIDILDISKVATDFGKKGQALQDIDE